MAPGGKYALSPPEAALLLTMGVPPVMHLGHNMCDERSVQGFMSWTTLWQPMAGVGGSLCPYATSNIAVRMSGATTSFADGVGLLSPSVMAPAIPSVQVYSRPGALKLRAVTYDLDHDPDQDLSTVCPGVGMHEWMYSTH